MPQTPDSLSLTTCPLPAMERVCRPPTPSAWEASIDAKDRTAIARGIASRGPDGLCRQLPVYSSVS